MHIRGRGGKLGHRMAAKTSVLAAMRCNWVVMGPHAILVHLSDMEHPNMRIEAKLNELGLILPEPFKPAQGLQLPFAWVRVQGKRAYISGHGPFGTDGSLATPLGKV